MKTILYLLSMDWNWIKQRPQFIAEELMKSHDVKVLAQYRYNRKGYQSRQINENVYTMKVIPRIDRYRYLRGMNVILKRRIVTKMILNNAPECIYITDPEEIEWIPQTYKGIIIYDCMDNHRDLASTRVREWVCLKCERKLAAKADVVIFSSEYLKNLFNSRYAVSKKVKQGIVRNGYDGNALPIHESARNEKFILCYVGTISYWFDFDVIIESLNCFDNITYLLVGPVDDLVSIPKHDRIKYIGTVEHDEIYDSTKHVDCYVMPFTLNEAIKAVDPVKLYEYINFGKNIISISYDEIKRYEGYVHFYNNSTEYLDKINLLLQDNKRKYTEDMRLKLLRQSSWKSRVEQMLSIIEG